MLNNKKLNLDYAVLLAAGCGTRMGHLTQNCPKCLIPVNGRPLLDYWLEKCSRAGIQQVYINGYYLAEQVEAFLEQARNRYDLNIRYIREKKLSGTGDFLCLIRDELKSSSAGFVCHADNFTDLDLSEFMKFHYEHDAVLSVALFHSKTPKSCGIVEEIAPDGRILKFREKPSDPKTDLASGAMFILTPEILDMLPDHEMIDFSKEILPQLENRMYGYVIPGYNIDIGTPESYACAEKLAKSEKRMNWLEYCSTILKLLNRLTVTDGNGKTLTHDEAFRILEEITLRIRAERKTIYCIGNGASASIASHFSADMAKNGKLHTEVFSDLALLTAISNDLGYEEVFAEPLRRRGMPGDLLAAISSSGNSPNVVRAAECAHQFGLQVVTFTAMAADNRLRKLGDLNFYFPAQTYGDAESVHGAVLHYWINMFLEKI